MQEAQTEMAARWRELQAAELAEYAWKYFALHADQRLRTFTFFLILATIVVGGSLTALENKVLTGYGAAIGFFALSFFAFVFWKLDQRNQQLVKHGEAALKAIEDKAFPPRDGDALHDVLSIFTNEEQLTSLARSSQSWWAFWSWSLSYSKCFGLVFFAVFALGLALGFFSVAKL